MISGILGLLVALIGLVIGIAAFVFWIWMIVDCANNRRLGSSEKIVWILVVVLLHCLGALIYFVAGRRRDY